MQVAAIGAVDYATALDGLSLKQAQLMLTTQGIVGEEQKDLLVKQGLLASSERMSASLVKEGLATSGLVKTKQDDLLISLGLMDKDTKELISTNAVTESKLREALAEQGVKGAKADTIVASILQTGQNAKEALSWDVLAASIKSSMLALAQNPLTWIAVAAGAVVGFIKIVDHFAITAEKLNEQLQELKATEEELTSTQSKLSEIDTKISDIQSKGVLSLTDKSDVSNLLQEKALLEDEMELLKLRKELQQDEYNKNAKKYADSEYDNYTHGQGDVSNLIKDYKGYKAKSERTDIDQYFIDDAKEKLKETKADLVEYRNVLNENISNLAPDDNESKEKLETVRDAIEKLIYTEEELSKIKFDRFLADTNNSDIAKGFEEIKADGEVSAQEIDNLANKFPALKQFMDENSISAETLAAEFNNIATASDSTASAVKGATSSLEAFEKVSDNIGKLSSVYKELNDNGYITIGTINDIKEATGLSGDEWAEYETKLLNAKKGSAEFNQVMSDLTYKIIENQVSVGDLANATDEEVAAIEKKIAATLRENGVTNASAVAHDYMAQAVVNAAFAAYDGTEASYEHYKGLLTQYEGSAVAQQGMIGLKNAQDIYNVSNLDVSQKLTALQELGYFLQHDIALMQNLASTSITFSDGKFWVNSWDENGNWLGADEYHGFDIKMPEITPPKYSGGSSSGSSSSSDKNEELENYLKYCEELYKVHQDELKYIHDIQWGYDNLAKTEEERKDILDKIEQARKDYADNQVKDLEHQIALAENLNGEYADTLEYYNRIQEIAHNEADRLRSIGYDDNSDEVQEWQNKCENSS